MKRFRDQKGLSLAELLVGAAILITVFSLSFKNLVQIRGGMNRVTTSGPHLFFESFAVSRLKLYFAKLMQWTTHVCVNGSSDTSCFCNNADFFAYSPIKEIGSSGKGSAAVGNMTLGLDLRLALSTFAITDVAPNGARGPFNTLLQIAEEKRADAAADPWGAMIPFHDLNKEWIPAHKFSRDWCKAPPPRGPADNDGSLGSEMCDEFAKCTAVAGRARQPNQIGTYVGTQQNIGTLTSTSMCFIFVGNMFSRSEMDVFSASRKSVGLSALDYPSVIGLAVSEARFVNNTNSSEITCTAASTEMNRSLKVKLKLYTALHADLQDVKKLQIHKSLREITGEKLGVSIPNCFAPGRGGSGELRCIEDPTWNYECATSC